MAPFNLKLVIALCCISSIYADLRFAATPKGKFAVQDRRNSVNFVTQTAGYMEPGTFGYNGLANQKKNNYDNFLRSNVDNEQDNRNFNNEDGKDMLPFRTLEAAGTDLTGQLPADKILTVETNKETTVPLRWNNPHAAEMEVNIWIMEDKYVVPIKKPVCSGEGHQDNAVSFTIPADFNTLASKVPGFTGCNKIGDCVIQFYAHSVEPRVYSVGVPLIVPGFAAANEGVVAATDNSAIGLAAADPWMDLSKQPRDVCLPSTDASANILTAVPRNARQVSDVYNHAYQNSDFSPYSGQQQEAISKNMQAACVVRMVVGNRGELGKEILGRELSNLRNNLNNKVNNLVAKYEQITNKIIAKIQTATANTGTVGNQRLATCARCAEVGATSANRLQTATYVPSFQVPDAQVATAKSAIPSKYANLMDANNIVKIYEQTLNDMSGQFAAAAAKGLLYQPAALKTSSTTKDDATGFKKRDAAGKQDKGVYAATKAKEAAAKNPAPQPTGTYRVYASLLTAEIDSEAPVFPDSEAEVLPPNPDDEVQTDDEESLVGAAPSARASLAAVMGLALALLFCQL